MQDMVQIRRGGRQPHQGPEARIGRSQFNRSHGVKMTFDESYLYPILVDEVLPGDTFTCKLNGFARIFSPLDSPVMDNIELRTFFFFCPSRILWNRWEDFNGAHDAAGAQDTTYTIPIINDVVVNHDTVKTGHGLAAYFGLPEGLTTSVLGISALPFRMYNRIWNEWFRDQQVQAEEANEIGNGPDGVASYALKKGNKKHDYFTSALPYLQKGGAITGSWDVIADPAGVSSIGAPSFVASDSTPTVPNFLKTASTATDPDVKIADAWTADETMYWDDPQLIASIDTNALRQAVAIQRLLEKDARGGTRYVEIIKAHFGVTSPDFRLQRPEYLGGGKSFINISPVANTSSTATEDQGELRGVGTGIIRGHGWAKSFTEHGYVMGLVMARGDITYFQGLDRFWSRSTRYDFYIPALASLGEQSILNQEIWVSNVLVTDTAVFAYQERWSEYRTKHSKVNGHFNPDITGSLAHWHIAEDFGSLPTFSSGFVNDVTPMSRVTTVDNEPTFLLDLWFNYKCARPMPVYSVPSLVARF